MPTRTPKAPRSERHQRSHADRLKLFAENEKLAYFACEKWMRGNSGYMARYRLEREDLQTVALTAVWEATERYDQSRGKFSTVATMLVFSRLSHVLRGCSTKRNGGGEAPEAVSLSAPIPGTEEATYLDKLVAPDSETPEGHLPRFVWDLVSGLPAPQARALTLYYRDDLTTDEAGQVLGVSRQCVNRNMKRGLEALRVRLQNLDAVLN